MMYHQSIMRKHTFKKNERSDHIDISCHFWRGRTLCLHYHEDYYEIIIVTNGNIESNVGDNSFHQSRKDVTIIRPGVSHSVEGTDESEHFNIAVKADRFERFLAGKDAVKNALSKREYLTVGLSDNEFDYLTDCIGRIDEDCSTSLSLSLAEAVISVILIAVMGAEFQPSMQVYNAKYYCRDAIAKMENGTAQFKSAGDIYALYPVSHTSFIDEFKNLTGKTPSEYLRHIKLVRAEELLINTSRSVLDIAYEVGYDSMSHFIKCFKAKYGMTPLKYRKADNSTETEIEDE